MFHPSAKYNSEDNSEDSRVNKTEKAIKDSLGYSSNPAECVESAESVKSVESAKFVKSTESVESVEFAESVESVESVESLSASAESVF